MVGFTLLPRPMCSSQLALLAASASAASAALLPSACQEHGDLTGALRGCAQRARELAPLLAGQDNHGSPWADFLLGLDDAELCTAEAKGLAGLASLPPSMRTFIEELQSYEHMLLPAPRLRSRVEAFRMKQRKAEQVAACLEVLESHFDLQAVRRVVDLGAGRGALTRALAGALQVPGLGLDLDEAQLEAARAVEVEDLDVSFRCCDVRKAELTALLRPGDVVVGLHPCGSLGDHTIQALAEASVRPRPSLLLVSCCLHGRGWAPVPNPRTAISKLGQAGIF
ncbi:unnamed protein product [Effrenium voratum]|nr:unnamed protein product [Effrenium voratum]